MDYEDKIRVFKGNENLTLDDVNNMIIVKAEPHIYAFSTETIPNYVKVGDTFRPIEVRLDEWRKEYQNLKRLFPDIKDEDQGLAKISKDVYFRDYSLHSYLKNEKGGYHHNLTKAEFDDLKISGNPAYSNEFFGNVDVEDIVSGIEDIKKEYEPKGDEQRNPNYFYYKLKDHKDDTFHWKNNKDWKLRDNQRKVVDNFVEKVANGKKELLMYAVMRFGKSFTSLCCAVEKGYKKILVVSAKADVANEWKKTVEMPILFKNYRFLCDSDFRTDPDVINHTLNTSKDKNADDYLKDKNAVVVFLTLQNLSGKNLNGDDIKEKLKNVFAETFDIVIVDETHFGAWAKIYGSPINQYDAKHDDEDDSAIREDETEHNKLENLINNRIKSVIKLHLSGTPYNLLYKQQFDKDNIIATVQFRDILDDKKKWEESHKLDIETGKINEETRKKYQEYDNPYFGFPEMLRFAFNLPDNIIKELSSTTKKSSWGLNTLFSTHKISNSSVFKYERDVLDFLKIIDGTKKDDSVLDFLDLPNIKNGNMCKHIVMVLPFKSSCDAMENLLKNNRFNKLSNYNVLNITGYNVRPEFADIENIKRKITEYEIKGERTITLTVKRMLTGVTVPEWDTMIMLKETKSAQEYDQAVFRIQNQYVKEVFSDELENANNDEPDTYKIDMKPQTILVDFDPVRLFHLQGFSSEIVNTINGSSEKLSSELEKDLEYSKVITLNGKNIVRVTPNNIMQIISNYNANKSIMDDTEDIEPNEEIKNDKKLFDYIMAQTDKGISNNGLTGKIYEDGPVSKYNDPSNTPLDDGSTQQMPTENSSPEGKDKIQKEFVKKFRFWFSRILFYTFLSKSDLNNLDDIINSVCSQNIYLEDNKRIFFNLGLNTNLVKELNMKSKTMLIDIIQLNRKIKQANFLSRDPNLTQENKVKNALKRFSRISDSEIVTPQRICQEMLECIGKENLGNIVRKNGRILDIASKTAEFSVSLFDILKDENKEKLRQSIYAIPTSPITYELTRKIYEILGIPISHISQITSYQLLKIYKKNDDGTDSKEIDYDKICELLTQDKQFDKIRVNDIIQGGRKVEFDAIVGNPPYQETLNQTENQTQGNSVWIYQYFQFIADKLALKTCLIYPFGGWFDSPTRLNGLGTKILTDGHTICIYAYEGTSDKRAWYRTDKSPSPIFENNANLSAGISIVYRDNCFHESFEYSNRIYSDEKVEINLLDAENLAPNPLFVNINKKLGKEKISKYSIKGIFNIESDYVEKNPNKVSFNKHDWKNPIQLFTNDKSGSSGRAKLYWTDKSNILSGQKYFEYYKIVISSAYPKKSIVSGGPTILNVKKRMKELIDVLSPNSAFGRSRMALFMSKNKVECDNYIKYLETNFFAGLALQEPNRSSTFGDVIPIQDFTDKSDIDWSKSIPEIDKQLYKKYKLTDEEINFIESTIKPME